jgi:hypothetical protein
MDQNISEYSPSNTQALLRMVEALVAGYRNGGNVYVGVDEISAEWERQNLPCRIKDHFLALLETDIASRPASVVLPLMPSLASRMEALTTEVDPDAPIDGEVAL